MTTPLAEFWLCLGCLAMHEPAWIRCKQCGQSFYDAPSAVEVVQVQRDGALSIRNLKWPHRHEVIPSRTRLTV